MFIHKIVILYWPEKGNIIVRMGQNPLYARCVHGAPQHQAKLVYVFSLRMQYVENYKHKLT